MTRRVPGRLTPLAAGAWFTLLVGGLIAPVRARADCSHYVIALGQHDAPGLNDLEVLSPARSFDGRSDGPPGRPSPCAGLSCSRNPMPPMTPVPSGSLRADVLACLHVSPRFALPLSLALPERAVMSRPVHGGYPPERPPRIS